MMGKTVEDWSKVFEQDLYDKYGLAKHAKGQLLLKMCQKIDELEKRLDEQ